MATGVDITAYMVDSSGPVAVLGSAERSVLQPISRNGYPPFTRQGFYRNGNYLAR